MPNINCVALEKMMRKRNMLFKHQLSNLVGVSYTRLCEVMSGDDPEVDEQILDQLCVVLCCVVLGYGCFFVVAPPCASKILPSRKCRPLGCMVTPCLNPIPHDTPMTRLGVHWKFRVEPWGWLGWAEFNPLDPCTCHVYPQSTCCHGLVSRSRPFVAT